MYPFLRGTQHRTHPMASRNDITGANLTSKHTTDKYRAGWDTIFGETPEQKSDSKKNPKEKK